MLTKKDFVYLAKTISEIPDATTRIKIARLISELCVQSNPRFDRDKFYKACGVD